jgi:putative zinc finger/helix-turn-helix YgiT family protein
MTIVLEGSLHRKCGGRYEAASETVTLRVSGMAATVERGMYRCTACGDEHRTVEQREGAEQAAVSEVRARHGLMIPKEIRQLRERLALTHEQLGDLLYGVPRSVVEAWERGRYVQNPDADQLMRSLLDRETLERRAAKAGVVLPVPALELGVAATVERPVEVTSAIPVVLAADAAPLADAVAAEATPSLRPTVSAETLHA